MDSHEDNEDCLFWNGESSKCHEIIMVSFGDSPP